MQLNQPTLPAFMPRLWRTPFANPMVKVEVELRRQLGMPVPQGGTH